SSPGNCVDRTEARFSTRTVTTAGVTASTTLAYEVAGAPAWAGAICDAGAADKPACGERANPMPYPVAAVSASTAAPIPVRDSTGRRRKLFMIRDSLCCRNRSHQLDARAACGVMTGTLHACNGR